MREPFFHHFLKQVAQHPRAENIVHIIVGIFLVFSLCLPPVSAVTRILYFDYPLVTRAGGAVSTPDGAQLLIPQGALTKPLRLKMASIPGQDFLSKAGDSAAEALSKEPVTLQSSLYRFHARGPLPQLAILTLPLPEGVAPTLTDLYAWDGHQWAWMPAHVIPEDGVVEANLSSIPSMVTVVQVERLNPSIATVLAVESNLPDKALGIITEVHLASFYLNADGTVSYVRGASQSPAKQGYLAIPMVSNRRDGQVQPEVLNSILLDPEARSQNIAALALLAAEEKYAGVQLDYQGLDPRLREEYTSFVEEVADALHKQEKLLSVRVEAPRQVAEDRWETGAYDWQALGKAVDFLVIPAIDSPSAYTPGGSMEALLRWAVGEVSRTKLQVALSAYSYKVVNKVATRVPYLQALSELCQVAVKDNKAMVSPGEDVTLLLPKLYGSSCFNYAANTGTYWLSYQGERGEDCQLWLENATSMAQKLRLIASYNVRGVTLENLLDEQNDERLWDLLKQFKGLSIPSIESDFEVVWTVQGPNGEESAAFSLLPEEGAGSTAQELSEKKDSAGSLPAPHYVWHAPDTPGEYLITAFISDDGGRTADVRSNSVVVQIPTPTPTPAPKPKQVAAAAPASRGPGFDYGIQGDAITDSDHGRLFGLIKQLGFRWYKQQVEWFRYNPGPGQYDWGALDRIVDSANAAGIKLLFSVVKAPKWARPPEDTDQGPPADPSTYAAFLREMAARYKGRVQAYEIWNEQNLYYEWGGLGGKLNARKYVELLKAAYQAIKSVDPNATVVSGALTPTGYNDGNVAIDDRVYLEQMYQAGLKNYCDAIGAHPSGYNNPPDARWESYQDPSATFNAKGHPSWFFRSTLESYRNIMVKYGDGAKRIWVTEFGWASVDGLGVPPARGYEYAADNTEAEQAQYIVRAYELAKSWGWVGPMFLWNLNFGPLCGCQDEKAAFGIIRPDWSPRPAFVALANMPK